MVTARAAGQQHLLAEDSMKDWFQSTLFAVSKEFGWKLQAWAILSNHYHFIGHSSSTALGAANSLGKMLRKLHSFTTKGLNLREDQPGRSRLWQNYRETHLTHQAS